MPEVIHYLGDFLLIELPGKSPKNLDKLRIVFGNLNVPFAEHNVEGPVQSFTFLGISLDTRFMQASLPLIHAFARSQVCTKKKLQSLLGMLNFAIRIIPLGCSFISQFLVFLSQAQDPDQIPRLDQAVNADLAM